MNLFVVVVVVDLGSYGNNQRVKKIAEGNRLEKRRKLPKKIKPLYQHSTTVHL